MNEKLLVKNFTDYTLDNIFDRSFKEFRINESMFEEDDIEPSKILPSIIDALGASISLGVDVTKWIWGLINKLGNKKWVLILAFAALIKYGYNPHEVMSDLEEEGYKISAEQKEDVIDKAQKKTKKNVKLNPFGGEGKDLEKFMKIMAQRESSNNPLAINDDGYIGLYQFGVPALKDVDLYPKVNKDRFKKDPSCFPEPLQHKAMKKLISKNKNYLRGYYKYVGRSISGVKITEAGLLAGAHLVGHGGVKKFLKSNGRIVPRDGNNVPVTEYMKMFQNMNLEI
jgi:hypothetical protein